MKEYAFPFPSVSGHPGMTLRDYFAAAALTGILANNQAIYSEWNARYAYETADAMLSRRAK
jgi:hypothetical protein